MYDLAETRRCGRRLGRIRLPVEGKKARLMIDAASAEGVDQDFDTMLGCPTMRA